MFSWFRKMARSNDFSKDKVCGFDLGVPTGCDDAIKWFRKAAEKGTRWGQLNLGIRYLRGEGVPQDYTEAMKWFKEGSAQGDPLSQYYLGTLHEKGLGTVVDQVEAYKWYGLAANQGIQEAENARQKLRHELIPEQVLEAGNRAAASSTVK
jgi:uncharacterized protein